MRRAGTTRLWSPATAQAQPGFEVGLNAAVVAVQGDKPLILVTRSGDVDADDGLPFGPFDPICHGTMETGLRSWVETQTALKLGYVEQLYTFADLGRDGGQADPGQHVISVGYLALTRLPENGDFRSHGAQFEDWYAYFPWEDWREGRPDILDAAILPALEIWAGEPARAGEPQRAAARQARLAQCFATGGLPWDEERALERYELMHAAGIVAETADAHDGARRHAGGFGRPMRLDHRRILATAISRLRGKMKYRPVVFELMAPDFTLSALQYAVEAIAGTHLHKQNFRRLVEQTRLVEPTGEVHTSTGGRPARLFRFRRDVVRERPAPGLRYGARA